MVTKWHDIVPISHANSECWPLCAPKFFLGSILDHQFKCSKYILADKNSKFILFNLHFVSSYNLMQLLLFLLFNSNPDLIVFQWQEHLFWIWIDDQLDTHSIAYLLNHNQSRFMFSWKLGKLV